MNKVILQGRLTADIEVSGKKTKYANFTLAVRDGVDEEGNPQAQFIRCVAFNKSAEVLEQFTSKGMPLVVCGRLKNSSYEDEDGVTKYSTNVIVDDFDLIVSKKSEDEEEKKTSKKTSKYHK